MTYQCIDQLQQKAEAVASLCRLLEVSRSGYYAARRRASRPARVCPVTPHLQTAFAASKAKTGGTVPKQPAAARGSEQSGVAHRALPDSNPDAHERPAPGVETQIHTHHRQ